MVVETTSSKMKPLPAACSTCPTIANYSLLAEMQCTQAQFEISNTPRKCFQATKQISKSIHDCPTVQRIVLEAFVEVGAEVVTTGYYPECRSPLESACPPPSESSNGMRLNSIAIHIPKHGRNLAPIATKKDWLATKRAS